jgi:HEPN domain-containing protein
MNRSDFQNISKIRVKEARALIDKGFYSGAYYLLGYAVECALKACIASKTKKFDFPDKKLVNQSYTHDLVTLLRLSGLEPELENEIKQNSALNFNWTTVKDWSEDYRYNTKVSKVNAKNLYSAVTARKNGVLPWLEKYW